MKSFTFFKMEALGNDYVYVITEQNPGLDINELIKAVPEISKRNFGVGSDGLILIGRDNNNIWCRIFNADGSEAETCGNGLRSVARLCFDLGWVDGNEFKITLKKTDHAVRATIINSEVSIEMGIPEIGKKEKINYNGNDIEYTKVSMTNPHAVIEEGDLESLDITGVGPFIEQHKNFPNRTNVEFFKLIDESNVRFRVWERGSGETKACGSGACAVVAALYKQKRCKDKVCVQMPGGRVLVSVADNGCIYLTGPVSYVFRGEYLRS